VYYSDTEIRKITELEASRIQDFPDSYIFTGSKQKVYHQIGNSVACGVAKFVGEKIISLLEQEGKQEGKEAQPIVPDPYQELRSDFGNKKVTELVQLCKQHNLKGYTKYKTKPKLIEYMMSLKDKFR
jgi:hypothetical protein